MRVEREAFEPSTCVGVVVDERDAQSCPGYREGRRARVLRPLPFWPWSVAPRQRRDVLGVLEQQQERLDYDYLEQTAATLGVSDLLERAREQAGLKKA